MTSVAASAPVVGRTAPSRSDTGPDASELTDLVERARRGVRAAQSTLFRRYAAMMNDTAFRLLPWGEEADDVVQDSFVLAITRLHQLHDPTAFRSWLKTIVVRTAHKRLRRRRLAQRLGIVSKRAVDLDEVLSGHVAPDVGVELRAIYRRIEDLPAEPRVALILRKVEGLSIPEIAAAMGKSEGTVKRRLRVAEDLIAAQLEPKGGTA
ncbi:MAG: RNA polymerase sigma factor [Myxococcota bacterium]